MFVNRDNALAAFIVGIGIVLILAVGVAIAALVVTEKERIKKIRVKQQEIDNAIEATDLTPLCPPGYVLHARPDRTVCRKESP